MRSQASKPVPKKGDLNKTTLKSSTSKQIKKKTPSPKKVKKSVGKSVLKGQKKNNKDDVATKNDEESTVNKNDATADSPKVGTSRTRSDSPAKKTKKDLKEKKDPVKTTPEHNPKKPVPESNAKKSTSETNVKKVASDLKKLTPEYNAKKPAPENNAKKSPPESNIKKPTGKKSVKTVKKGRTPRRRITTPAKSNDPKYKQKTEAVKKVTAKFTKVKTVIKKGNAGNQKKKVTPVKQELQKEDLEIDSKDVKDICDKNNQDTDQIKKDVTIKELKDEKSDTSIESSSDDKSDIKIKTENSPSNNSSKMLSSNQADAPKVETERPPKFFTSSRSPRTVDIDVKCLKNSKGNLSVSERFLSMKFETKTDEGCKDKNISNTLVSQGPEIDVYTFTEKVDSPKNILSDFRNPINKNVGRVRPIARVKGTVIDKKTDSERKKYSPHRPIEEVVKQLKANKRSEECASNQDNDIATSSVESTMVSDDPENEDKPKPIVSKSYKMVARKSSVTGKPFSPIKFLDAEPTKNEKSPKTNLPTKKSPAKSKKTNKKNSSSDDELDTSKFALNTKTFHYSSSEESVNESNDDNETKESSGSDTSRNKKQKNKKYKKITDSSKKTTSKELKELSKDSLIDLKDDCVLMGGEKPSKRRLKLLSMWSGPKKHRMASLNAIAKVHCLYENESRTHMELGLMKTVDRQLLPSTSKVQPTKKKESKPKDEKQETTSESEYENKKDKKDETSESSDDSPPQRTLRGVPGIRSAGKYWDPKSSTSSSEESEQDTKKKVVPDKKKLSKTPANKSDSDKPPAKMKKTAGVPVKKKRNRNEVVMDLKDMVVQKRMASLNATAILAASYEKRSPKSNKDETTSDSCSDESFSQKPKNVTASGVKSESKNEEPKKEVDESALADRKQKVEFIVNQDTDVTITGVYSTHHHEGFCTVSGMQYRISSTSHTQTTATANCEKEGCSREDGARYTPLSALSSMQPPAEHAHTHPHPVPELGGLARRAGCSSAFSAPSPAAHHEPGYYQPAGPLIKESSAEADRALARYHPQPHYHAPHPTMLQQYGPPYYPELCYGRYYRQPGPYHMPPPQPDAQMVGVGAEPYPQYYGTPPCYQHSPQRIPYVEYRCPCPLNACPKNVLIGPATGKAPTGGGPVDVPSALAPPGAAFRPKARACVLDAAADTHGSGKDPPLEPEPPAATDAPHPCPLPAIGGASPKREMYDVRDGLRLAGGAEALGPPSPARGSAGACAPQPPSAPPRRARLGKDMARRSLAPDDTALLLAPRLPPAPPAHPALPAHPAHPAHPALPTPPAHHSDADDDVLAVSPPICVPIDLSSSDERSTPLVDVKKENEGPTYASARKPEAQALREQNNCTVVSDLPVIPDAAKAAKRRFSRPKLEIDMKDTQLEDVCKTNGIGEHVKLQKRRKVSGDQSDLPRIETVTKEPKKKSTQAKRGPKPNSEKKCAKRKLERSTSGPRAKKMLVDPELEDEARTKNVPAMTEERPATKPKTKSALLLDNLLRKNSIDRIDAKGYASDTELNPAELFLSPKENISQTCPKKTLNINNNIVENAAPTNGVRSNTMAAVTQLIEKKLAYKNACKVEKVDSKVTNSVKSVLKTPTATSDPIIEDLNVLEKCELSDDKQTNTVPTETEITKPAEVEEQNEITNITAIECPVDNQKSDTEASSKSTEPKSKTEAEIKTTNEVSSDESQQMTRSKAEKQEEKKETECTRHDRTGMKRCKLANGELKAKNVEKVVKLLVSKRPAIKTDEATLVIEEACASPTPSSTSRGRQRRRGGAGGRRGRRPRSPPLHIDLEPRAPPRWSNGWKWDGDHYVSKVYLNNDSRLDRTARCWARMWHASGDSVSRGDCVLLRASVARAQPFVARVASLWENPDDGEMMVSLVWYYRPEHTERGRQAADAPDEVFASRHRDANSVACIEDKCYVLTFNEYCRYRKRLKAAEEGITMTPSIVPPLPPSEVHPAFAPNDSKLPPSVSPELVLFCRKIYDFRSKKIHMPNK